MLYSRKGDDGETTLFNSKDRVSKRSEIIDLLGNLDELNSFLGICRSKSGDFAVFNKKLKEILKDVQENIFIIQANVAGAGKKIGGSKVRDMERLIDSIDRELPEVSEFIIFGENELSSFIDHARTISRRAERSYIKASEKKKIVPEIIQYLNRLSTLLYALSRFVNLKAGIKEDNPAYK